MITNTATFNDGLGHTFSRSSVTAFKVFDLSASTKTVDRTEAASGDSLTYTIHVHNASDQSYLASVRDDIPAHTTYIPGSLSATWGTVYTATGRIEWTGDLPYTTTYTNTSGDYAWGDSLRRGAVPA